MQNALGVDLRQCRRWLRALSIAKILFEEEGYHTRYLDEIEHWIVTGQVAEGQGSTTTRRKRSTDAHSTLT